MAHNTLGIPMLDDDVKSLEATSLVTNNGTMIYQALTIGWLLLGYHCGIIKIKCSQVSNIG